MGTRSEQLNQWFDTRLGQRLIDAEAAAIEAIMPHLFGYHLVQIGNTGSGVFLNSSRIMHRCLLSQQPKPSQTDYSYICSTTDNLPLAENSVDVIVLPHILEFEDDPHEILREVQRVLIPNGYIVVLGFNPLSLWGLWRVFKRRRDTAPWCGKFLPILRLKDWFALLGFELELQQTLCFVPPIQNEQLMPYANVLESLGRRSNSAFGAVYLLVAKKRVLPVTMIKPPFRFEKPALSGVIWCCCWHE